MNFHEVRFPAALSFGSIGGPERRIEIVTLNSGHEERNSPWAHSRRRYDAGVALRSLDDMATVISFYEAREGQLFGFRWKDWSDYKSGNISGQPGFSDQSLGFGDGVKTEFELCKTYKSGEQGYCRRITKPVLDTVLIGMAGIQQFEEQHVVFDYETGVVKFLEPPTDGAEVTAGFEFDVPVRFDTDRIEMSVSNFSAGEIPSIPIIEVRI